MPNDRAQPTRKRRQPHQMTPDNLRKVAVAHLQRFPCSVRHLRIVMRRKITRSVRHYGDDEAELMGALDRTIAELDGGALLDDGRFAQARVRTLHRRGRSRRAIRQRLRQQGLDDATVSAALGQLDESEGDPELAAATRYAQRRRLGPFQRDATRRRDRRQKDLAALGRQGFSYAIARQVIDAGDPTELPELD